MSCKQIAHMTFSLSFAVEYFKAEYFYSDRICICRCRCFRVKSMNVFYGIQKCLVDNGAAILESHGYGDEKNTSKNHA